MLRNSLSATQISVTCWSSSSSATTFSEKSADHVRGIVREIVDTRSDTLSIDGFKRVQHYNQNRLMEIYMKYLAKIIRPQPRKYPIFIDSLFERIDSIESLQSHWCNTVKVTATGWIRRRVWHYDRTIVILSTELLMELESRFSDGRIRVISSDSGSSGITAWFVQVSFKQPSPGRFSLSPSTTGPLRNESRRGRCYIVSV